MPVSIGWVVARPELGLRLRGGSAGLRREIDLVVTTELESPFRWLSGGELVLTTGMRLPSDAAGRAEYMRGLWRCGVAGLGFGIGLTHDAMLPELVTAADELGLPLFEVPSTPPSPPSSSRSRPASPNCNTTRCCAPVAPSRA